MGAGTVGGGTGGRPLSDGLLRRATSTRLTTAAVAATAALVLFIPTLVIHSAVTALPCVVLAVAALSAQNPPIDAARPDIMPPWLWGRAEGVRTLRTPAQPLAPLLFGAASAYIFGGGTGGLWWTFVVMLLPLAAPTLFLFLARRHYPADVAAAAVLTRRAALGASSPWRQLR